MRENLGTVLVSICYSPDTKKMGVIVLRAKDLNKGNSQETGERGGGEGEGELGEERGGWGEGFVNSLSNRKQVICACKKQ